MNKVTAPSKADLKEAKRQELVARVKEAEARLDARGSRIRKSLHSARTNTSAFVTRYPLSSLTGGILLGVVIGRVIPRPRPRLQPNALNLARMTAATGRLYLAEARKIADRSIKVGRKAAHELEQETEDWREAADERVEEAIDETRSFARTAALGALAIVRAIRDRKSDDK